MTVFTENGYSWTDGKHARLLHAGNMYDIKTYFSGQDSGTTVGLLDNDLTVDKWIPFENEFIAPSDFSEEWSLTGVTLEADNQTITQTTDNSTHRILEGYTYTNVDTILAADIDRLNAPQAQLVATDGTSTFIVTFNLDDGTIATETGGASGTIIDLGNGRFRLISTFTPLAAAGNAQIRFADGANAGSFAGDTSISMKVERMIIHPRTAIVRLTAWEALAGDCIVVGAHNLEGGQIAFQHDSNNDSSWTSIKGYNDVEDNSPIALFFDPITSSEWRVLIRDVALPEIAIIRVGSALKFERPFYAGFTPARMNRQTEITGNLSGAGKLLGRSIKRTVLMENYSWQNLTYSWVRSNLDGKNGVIQSMEKNAAFIAWRPEKTDDVSLIMQAELTPPKASGTRDLWSFDMSAEVHSYE